MAQGRNPFDEAQAATRRECRFCAAVAGLSKTRRQQTLEALADSRYKGATILRVLEGWGIRASVSTVRNHRPVGSPNPLCRTMYPEGPR